MRGLYFLIQADFLNFKPDILIETGALKMKTLLAVLTLSLISSLSLAGELKDPQRHLSEISSYLGRPNFNADFKCGDKSGLSGSAKIAKVKVESVELSEEIICEGNSKILRTKILSSQGAANNIEINGESLGNFFENMETADLVLDRDTYEADPKAYLFELVNNLGESDSILIKSVKFDDVKGPGDVKVKAMIVQVEVEMAEVQGPAMFKKMNIKIFVSRDLPGVSRIFKTEVSTGKVLIMSTAGAKLEVNSVSRGK
jgi:hypothetical protein